MRIRKELYGDRNIIGKRLLERRKEFGLNQKDLLTKLQLKGIEMSSSSLSKIEGQLRAVKDYELAAFCEILDIDAKDLLGLE